MVQWDGKGLQGHVFLLVALWGIVRDAGIPWKNSCNVKLSFQWKSSAGRLNKICASRKCLQVN